MIEEIRLAVDLIFNTDDGPTAHILEDNLYETFVKYVAEHGSSVLAAMAREVLKTKEIDFDRWYE